MKGTKAMIKIQKDFWAYNGMYIQRLYSNEWLVLDKNEKCIATKTDMRNAKAHIDKLA